MVRLGTEMSKTAILDRAHLRQAAFDDRALMQEVLGLFRGQAELWSRLLRPDRPDRGWVDAAHSLKGSARGIGAWKLAEACDLAEKLGRQPSPSIVEVSVRLQDLRSALDDALVEVMKLDQELALLELRSAS